MPYQINYLMYLSIPISDVQLEYYNYFTIDHGLFRFMPCQGFVYGYSGNKFDMY
jgi:hypothetical protein